MLAAIQSYFGEGAVLLMVIGACLLAIRSLRRQHRQKGSARGGCGGRRAEGSLRRRLRGLRHEGNLSQRGTAEPAAQRLPARSSSGAIVALSWLIFRRQRQSAAAKIGKRSCSVQPSGHFHSSSVKILI